VSFAFRHAPGESLDALDATLNLECIQQDHIYVLPRIKHIWTEAIAELLLTKATRLDMKAGCISELLDLLIDHQVSKAVGLAGSLASATDVQSEFSIIAGCVLARHPGIAWQTVWPLIRDNPRYGRLVLEKLASFSFSDDSKVYSGLREEDLADLIVWLFRQYPVTDEANPPHGAVGPEFQIASWRDGSLTELKIRGTYAACAQLNRIIEQLPQYPWLKWHLREALTLARQNTWKPPMPGELMKLFANKSARLVQSGSQLLDVIIESLQRLQIKLHDFLPATADLWNNSEGIFRPKSENELSDYVARHLKDDLSSRGIVANREVEIRRKQGDGAPGQRTDIYVNATTDGSTSRFDIITAVIETKGCWNPDLSHAMKTQLVDRYLAESQCAYGLYLIGWFNCNQWDREDSRRNAAPWVEASEMQEKYAAQAVTLSQHGRLIKAFVLDVALR
jgi:hypothetical protein